MKILLIQGEIETLLRQVYEQNNLRIVQKSITFNKDSISGSISVRFDIEPMNPSQRIPAPCCDCGKEEPA